MQTPLYNAKQRRCSRRKLTPPKPLGIPVYSYTPPATERYALGKIRAKRERLLQHEKVHGKLSKQCRATFNKVQKRIEVLEKQTSPPTIREVLLFIIFICVSLHEYFPCCTQVYELLENEFSSCPWPVPPAAILKHLPIPEVRGGKKEQTSEMVLKQMIKNDKSMKTFSPWNFRPVGPNPEYL